MYLYIYVYIYIYSNHNRWRITMNLEMITIITGVILKTYYGKERNAGMNSVNDLNSKKEKVMESN